MKNATRNQQPTTIEIKRIEKVKGQESMETRRWLYLDRTVILKLCNPYSDCIRITNRFL